MDMKLQTTIAGAQAVLIIGGGVYLGITQAKIASNSAHHPKSVCFSDRLMIRFPWRDLL